MGGALAAETGALAVAEAMARAAALMMTQKTHALWRA